YVQNHYDLDTDFQVDDFNDYFAIGDRVYLDLWFCHKDDSNAGNERGFMNIKEDDIVTVESIGLNQHGVQMLTLKILDTGAAQINGCPSYGDCRPNNVFNKWIDDVGNYRIDSFPYPRCYDLPDNVSTDCPYGNRSTNARALFSYRDNCTGDTGKDDYNLIYKLLANKVPENKTGGGLRVKELRTKDNDKTYKVTYDYSHPTKNRSSGITSYAPVDGLKFVPYQSEIPSPGVMYEYVTMTESSESGNYYSKTRYQHHVLKPVFNIFNPNVHMEALDAGGSGEDEIFWANVSENYQGFNGNNSKNIEAKKIDININSALIGQIKSIENINSYGHVMAKTLNEYINGTILANQEPNKGYTKETFNSMKTIFQTNDKGTIIEDEKVLLSISSKTKYNNMLKKTTTIVEGQAVSVEYFDVDPWLSSFRRSKTTFSDGSARFDSRIPAYNFEAYSTMQSKVLNPTNKNML